MIWLVAVALVIALVSVIEMSMTARSFRQIQEMAASDRRVFVEVINELRRPRPAPSVRRNTDSDSTDAQPASAPSRQKKLDELHRLAVRVADQPLDARYIIPTDL